MPPEWEALCLRMMEKSREARFQSVTELALALGDLPRHAAAYAAARAGRAQSGHSGHTQVIAANHASRATMLVTVDSGAAAAAYPELPASGAYPAYPASAAYPVSSPSSSYPSSSARPAASSSVHAVAPSAWAGRSGVYPAVSPSVSSAIPVVSPPLASASGAYPAATAPAHLGHTSFDARSRLASLVEDPRHAGFARTLLARPGGRWFEVSEVCQASDLTQPASTPFELGLMVAWLEHPFPDPGVVAVVFLSIRSGWSTVVLCGRPPASPAG